MSEFHQFPNFDLGIEELDCSQGLDSSSGDEIIRNVIVDLDNPDPSTSTNKRFRKITEDERDQIIASNDSKNTQKSTRYAVKLLKSIFSHFYRSDLFLLINIILIFF